MITRSIVCRFCQLHHHPNRDRLFQTQGRLTQLLRGRNSMARLLSSNSGSGTDVHSVEELLLNETKDYRTRFKSRTSGRSQNDLTYNYSLPGRGKMSKRSFAQNKSVAAVGEVLYGFHPVYLAVEAGKRKCYELFIQNSAPTQGRQQILDMVAAKGIRTTYLHKGQLLSLSGARPNQGICMDVSPLPVETFDAEADIRKIRDDPNRTCLPIFLLACKVKDPMNFGAILRSSYFLGVDKVIVPQKESCGLTPLVSKASSGALEILPMSSYNDHEDLHNVLKIWREGGGTVIGTGSSLGVDSHILVTDGRPGNSIVPVESFVIDKPTLLIVGNEEKGIEDSILGKCDKILTISPKSLGDITARYRWFSVIYLVSVFFGIPALVFALSLAGDGVFMAVGIPVIVIIVAIVIVKLTQSKCPGVLPIALRTCSCLPLWIRSLEPYDQIFCQCCHRSKAPAAKKGDDNKAFDSTAL